MKLSKISRIISDVEGDVNFVASALDDSWGNVECLIVDFPNQTSTAEKKRLARQMVQVMKVTQKLKDATTKLLVESDRIVTRLEDRES